MKRFLLDTSALLTLRDDEPGAQRVADVLQLAQQGKAKCYGWLIATLRPRAGRRARRLVA